MAERPTAEWREYAAEYPEGAELFPESLLTRTDEVLAAFEAEVAELADPSDDDVFGAIERVVLVLNAVNEEYDQAAYETEEREQLCAYIEDTLTEAGVDVDALAARRGLTRHQITDEWREW
jgi:hypothetical protein